MVLAAALHIPVAIMVVPEASVPLLRAVQLWRPQPVVREVVLLGGTVEPEPLQVAVEQHLVVVELAVLVVEQVVDQIMAAQELIQIILVLVFTIAAAAAAVLTMVPHEMAQEALVAAALGVAPLVMEVEELQILVVVAAVLEARQILLHPLEVLEARELLFLNLLRPHL